MRRASKAKASKPTKVMFESHNEMFLRKAENKAVALLEEVKSTPDNRTRPVSAKNFGINSNLVMFVNPALSNEQIIDKFNKRLNTDFNSFYDKKNQHV